MNSLISVIVPVYNAQEYLEETIESVLGQTYPNFELLLINHNSNDNSINIMKRYESKDSRIAVLTLDINKGGPAYPRNEGVKIAKGKYICFLDSDDVWVETKLEKQLAYLVENSADIVHTLAYIIDDKSMIKGEFQNQRVFNRLKYILNTKSIIYYTNYININSVMMKNNQTVSFNEEKNLIAMEDWNLWMESIFNNKKVLLLNDKLIHYRVHSSSISKRDSDIGYRKSIYLLSSIFLKKEIPMRHYFFSVVFQLLKIVIKNFKRG